MQVTCWRVGGITRVLAREQGASKHIAEKRQERANHSLGHTGMWWISKTSWWGKEARHRKNVFCMLSFTWHSRRGKTNPEWREASLSLGLRAGRRWTAKGRGRKFWKITYILIVVVLTRGYTLSNSLKCTLKMAALVLYANYSSMKLILKGGQEEEEGKTEHSCWREHELWGVLCSRYSKDIDCHSLSPYIPDCKSLKRIAMLYSSLCSNCMVRGNGAWRCWRNLNK